MSFIHCFAGGESQTWKLYTFTSDQTARTLKGYILGQEF
jgi:hypothetical protein